MVWLYISLTWLAALFVANEVGLGRMTPWVGVFVFAVLMLGAVRTIYRWERKTKFKKITASSSGQSAKRTKPKVLIIGSDFR